MNHPLEYIWLHHLTQPISHLVSLFIGCRNRRTNRRDNSWSNGRCNGWGDMWSNWRWNRRRNMGDDRGSDRWSNTIEGRGNRSILKSIYLHWGKWRSMKLLTTSIFGSSSVSASSFSISSGTSSVSSISSSSTPNTAFASSIAYKIQIYLSPEITDRISHFS